MDSPRKATSSLKWRSSQSPKMEVRGSLSVNKDFVYATHSNVAWMSHIHKRKHCCLSVNTYWRLLMWLAEVLLEAEFLSVDPYMRWVKSRTMHLKNQGLVIAPVTLLQSKIPQMFFSLGRSAGFACKKETWWSELKWPSKKHKLIYTHTHAEMSLNV